MTPAEWALLIGAALLIGFAKTSVGGLAALAVAAFATVMPASVSTAGVLGLLLVGDVVAVIRYRRDMNKQLLVKLLPWVVPGIALGALFIRLVEDDVLRRSIGVLLLISLVMQLRGLLAKHRGTAPQTAGMGCPGTILAGVAAGFTTMTANAGGPVMTQYLLANRVNKMTFVGTGAWFFLIVNLFKVPFSTALGLFSWDLIRLDLMLAPAVLIGAAVGIAVVHKLSQRVFDLFAISASLLAAVMLLI